MRCAHLPLWARNWGVVLPPGKALGIGVLVSAQRTLCLWASVPHIASLLCGRGGGDDIPVLRHCMDETMRPRLRVMQSGHWQSPAQTQVHAGLLNQGQVAGGWGRKWGEEAAIAQFKPIHRAGSSFFFWESGSFLHQTMHCRQIRLQRTKNREVGGRGKQHPHAQRMELSLDSPVRTAHVLATNLLQAASRFKIHVPCKLHSNPRGSLGWVLEASTQAEY